MFGEQTGILTAARDDDDGGGLLLIWREHPVRDVSVWRKCQNETMFGEQNRILYVAA